MHFEMTRETGTGRLDWEAMTEWEVGTELTDVMAEAISDGLPMTVIVARDAREFGGEAFIVFDPAPRGDWSLRAFFPASMPVDREVRHAVGRIVDAMAEFVDNGA
jgi:hypothetical protein